MVHDSSHIYYLSCAFKMYMMIANLIGFLMQALGMQLLKKTDRPEQKVIYTNYLYFDL